ncbi:glutathione S-transferase [Acinetobacter calcoaceticus]|uniref:Glutathione S-transferase n=1 Tax=Acinetobacter calcoaceticus TaxID=471 RepID=A0A4R1XXC9_ACICA|nr:glutathione S-transferase [Acinetobacter calcoaceticus]
MLALYIGNKNYSTWSLRPWLVLTVFGIEFKEHWLKFDDFKSNSPFKQQAMALHPTGKVPLLQDGNLVIADSLAICEYLAERFPEKHLWPADRDARARARSICAEMHSGFSSIRNLCPMNIEADLSEIGLELWESNAHLNTDVQRIQMIWSERPVQGGFLCGEQFSIADAFYAPIILRMVGFGLPIDEANQDYVQRVLAVPALKQWVQQACMEHCFVEIDEPYRQDASTHRMQW